MSTISPTRSTHDHGTKADADVAPGEIAVGVVIGRASEYFDFFVFGIASALVFPAVFFPFMDRLQGTLWSFALFALAFVARPFGTSKPVPAVNGPYGSGPVPSSVWARRYNST